MKRTYKINRTSKELLSQINIFRSIHKEVSNEFLEGGGKISVTDLISRVNWIGNAQNSGVFSRTPFAFWPKEALEEMWQISSMVYWVAKENTLAKKKGEIKKLARRTAEKVHQFSITINDFFRIVPAETNIFSVSRSGKWIAGPFESKKLTPWLWYSLIVFGEHIKKAPKRLKLCPYCKVIFWDGETKPANRRICSKISCKKNWDRDRASKSYAERKK